MALLRIGYTDNVLNTANIAGGTLDMMFTDSVLILRCCTSSFCHPALHVPPRQGKR